MEYTINHSSIKAAVDEEVSRVASRSYAEDGASLYDGIRLVSRDEATLGRLVEDVVNILISRFRIFVSLDILQKDRITFNLPDLSEDSEDRIETMLDRFLSMGVVGRWLQEKGSPESAMYLERADASINEAELLMMTRRPVQRRNRR